MNKKQCTGFGAGWIGNAEDCLECKKLTPISWKECKKLTYKLIEESCSTDEEIEEYLKEKKK